VAPVDNGDGDHSVIVGATLGLKIEERKTASRNRLEHTGQEVVLSSEIFSDSAC
jgi:hypothetical protein